METLIIKPRDVSRTFTLNIRYDTHQFLDKELPSFLNSLSEANIVKFRNYFTRLRSGEYIPQASYSDVETEYVYLTVGQFSGDLVSFEELTFLDETVGKKYEHIQVNSGDIVITRSGTVGVVHIFVPPDDKKYIPSHHLAVIETPGDNESSSDYLRLFLQTEFARKYFWAFSTGKSQKEISNWSIKSIPIPQSKNPDIVAKECLNIENKIEDLQNQIEHMKEEKERVFYEAIRKLGEESM